MTSKSVRPLNQRTMHNLHIAVEPSAGQDVHLRRVKIFSFFGGLVFGSFFFALSYSGLVRISGPFLPVFLQMFHQKLEFIVRYQALSALPLAVYSFVLSLVALFAPQIDISRLERPLPLLTRDLLLSIIVSLVLACNFSNLKILVFAPFLSLTFFFGSSALLATQHADKGFEWFGRALTLTPPLIAIAFNGFGVLRMLFM